MTGGAEEEEMVEVVFVCGCGCDGGAANEDVPNDEPPKVPPKADFEALEPVVLPKAEDCDVEPKVDASVGFGELPKAEVVDVLLLASVAEPNADVPAPKLLGVGVDEKDELGWPNADEGAGVEPFREGAPVPKADVGADPLLSGCAPKDPAGVDCCWDCVLNVVDLLAKGRGLGRAACWWL